MNQRILNETIMKAMFAENFEAEKSSHLERLYEFQEQDLYNKS